MLNFKAVELKDMALLKSYLSQIPPYLIEHSFTTLLAWQQSYDFQFAIFEDYLFIGSNYQGVTSFLPPFSKNGICTVDEYRLLLKQLQDYCQTKNLPCILSDVGEHELPLLQQALNEQCSVRRDRNNANYIYEVSDLVALEGKKYHNKRNHLNSFQRNYPFYEFLPITADLAEDCMSALQRWTLENHKTEVITIQEEADAIQVLFDNFEALELQGACIKIGDRIEAFAIGEKMSDEMAAIIIEKANAEYKGLYAAINQMFLEANWQNFKYVNRAEDMGLANLRRTKLGYFPCKLAMKYILTL